MTAPEKSLRAQFLANVTAEIEARSMRTPAMTAFLEHVARMDDRTFEDTALPFIAGSARARIARGCGQPQE
ncbi:hypothetical protein [Paracoccus aeridis]|uniref:hypothetical protein n=1 Tax=Paracoccus aeridis TaxID=1966466 RepID=UPI0010AA85F3|nr:hypothetical protein [Paracoccus aeridis]